MPHPRYSNNEIVRRGQALYEGRIRADLDPSWKGKFLVVDIETGDYEIDASEVDALRRAKARNPGAALYLLRVGYPTAYRLGGKRVVAAR